jgi:hypothetical protein
LGQKNIVRRILVTEKRILGQMKSISMTQNDMNILGQMQNELRILGKNEFATGFDAEWNENIRS